MCRGRKNMENYTDKQKKTNQTNNKTEDKAVKGTQHITLKWKGVFSCFSLGFFLVCV